MRNYTEEDIFNAIEELEDKDDITYYVGDTKTGNVFIVPTNGSILCVDEYDAHSQFLEFVDEYLIQMYDEDRKEDGYVLHDYCVDNLGWVTLNTGKWYDNRCKIVIGEKRPTQKQNYVIRDFIDDVQENGAKNVLIYANGDSNWFDLTIYDSSDLMKIISRAFSVGILEEVKEEETDDEHDNQRMSNEYDSNGNRLTQAQADYFRNSKIRDSRGRLLVCYHGTKDKFDEFRSSKKGRNYHNYNYLDGRNMRWGRCGIGYYFTHSCNGADRWAFMGARGGGDTNIMSVYLNITNPYDVNELRPPENVADRVANIVIEKLKEERPEVPSLSSIKLAVNRDSRSVFSLLYNVGIEPSDVLRELGYDGVIGLDEEEYIAYKSNQIKSIDNKNPTSSVKITEDSKE